MYGLALRSKFAVDERVCNHVADRMARRDNDMSVCIFCSTSNEGLLAVSEVVEGALLVDDADGGLLGADTDGLDIVSGLAERFQFVVHDVRSLNRRLGMEFGGVRDLEEDILHHVRAIWPLELERFALQDVKYLQRWTI